MRAELVPEFHLHYSEVLQGDFTLAPRNLLVVFQVNCPGCFVYALPFATEVHEQLERSGELDSRAKVLALSTAFENFDRNTLENTQALVESGELTGETRAAFARQNFQHYPYALDFPVAFDRVQVPAEMSARDFAELAATQPGFASLGDSEQARFVDRIRERCLRHPALAWTFISNALPGTPTWLVLNDAREILYSAFGHLQDTGPLMRALLD